MERESVALKAVNGCPAARGFEGICVVKERAWLWSLEILCGDLVAVAATVKKRGSMKRFMDNIVTRDWLSWCRDVRYVCVFSWKPECRWTLLGSGNGGSHVSFVPVVQQLDMCITAKNQPQYAVPAYWSIGPFKTMPASSASCITFKQILIFHEMNEWIYMLFSPWDTCQDSVSLSYSNMQLAVV